MTTPPEPGTRLRLAREARGLSVHQLAAATRLAVRIVEAVESGHLSALPEGIYRRAIVRAVAREVGLPPDAVLADYQSARPIELLEPNVPRAVETAPAVNRALGRVATVIGAAVPILAGVCYLWWPVSHGGPSVAQALRSRTVRAVAVAPAGGLGAAPEAEGRVTVRLTVSARCPLLAVADGREVVNRLMEEGDALSVELGEELALSGDNAAAVQFSINGQAGQPFGDATEALSARIRRDDYASQLVRH